MNSVSSYPYRKAGSARTCGGIARLIRGAPVGMSCVVIVGVMRLTGTSCCLWEAAGLDDAGVRGFGGACIMHPIGPGGVGSIRVLEGEGGSDRRGCWGSVMSVAGKSLSMGAGEEGVGETECVVSVGFAEGVVVGCSWVVVVRGTEGVRSAIHCWICWATERLMEWNMWSS